MGEEEELQHDHALELICRGATIHRGHRRPVPHAPDEYYALYTSTTGARQSDGDDRAVPQDNMTPLMTLRLRGKGTARRPWETLEQPSYAYHFGRLKGTVTLNQWAGLASVFPENISLRDTKAAPREMSLERILERLQELQAGLEDDDEALLYRILYKRILRDPDRVLRPHRTIDRQITDLILVLSRPGWIDFTSPRNQVATRFIFDRGEEGVDEEHEERYRAFFHQLLLSMELELRIHSRLHSEHVKERLLKQIPPTIQWALALARRWRENVRVEEFGETSAQSTFSSLCWEYVMLMR